MASSSGLAPLSAPTPSDPAPAADRPSPPASSASVGSFEVHAALLSSSRSESSAAPSTSIATSVDGREASSDSAPFSAPAPLAPAPAAAHPHSSPASSVSDGVDAPGTSDPVLLTDLRGSSLDVSTSSGSSASTAVPMVAMQARLDQERAYTTELEARHRLLLASTASVAAWPPPTKVRELQAFLGFCNFFRRHIESFSETAAPLYSLAKKGVTWEWGPSQQTAFTQLRHSVTSAPVLRLPAWDRPFTLVTDCSATAAGAVSMTSDTRSRVVRELKDAGYQLPG